MRYCNNSAFRVVKTALILCALILLVSGCANLGEQTSALPPAPRTPGAIVTETSICIPHNEAAELMLWIEYVEKHP